MTDTFYVLWVNGKQSKVTLPGSSKENIISEAIHLANKGYNTDVEEFTIFRTTVGVTVFSSLAPFGHYL